MQESVNVSRALSAYLGRQRRNATDRNPRLSPPAVTPAGAGTRTQSPQRPEAGPDYGCVEWFMYEQPRA
jgi:hypothetical protein